MAKRVKNLIKKWGRIYLDNYSRMYGPAIKAGCNPFFI